MNEPRSGGGSRAVLRSFCLVAIAVLYGLSVPWYRETGETPDLWLGLPDWVAVAVLCYVGVAVLNSVAWLATPFEDPPPASQTDPSREPEDAETEAGR